MPRALTYLSISMGLALVSAVAFVIVMTLTLPDTDLAHGQKPFEDPLVIPIMTLIAVTSGIVGWPLFLLFGWRVAPKKVAVVTGGLVVGWILLTTPFHPAYGWPGSYVVCMLALAFCAVFLREKRHCKPGAAANVDPPHPRTES